jgi:hypothetical protein
LDQQPFEIIDERAKSSNLGRVTYSQQILKEFGWIEEAKGRGVTIRGSGYSLV